MYPLSFSFCQEKKSEDRDLHENETKMNITSSTLEHRFISSVTLGKSKGLVLTKEMLRTGQ
jgi:hypothetical protein